VKNGRPSVWGILIPARSPTSRCCGRPASKPGQHDPDQMQGHQRRRHACVRSSQHSLRVCSPVPPRRGRRTFLSPCLGLPTPPRLNSLRWRLPGLGAVLGRYGRNCASAVWALPEGHGRANSESAKRPDAAEREGGTIAWLVPVGRQ
jgi:hypothetical protein